jgi:hypothetical protein
MTSAYNALSGARYDYNWAPWSLSHATINTIGVKSPCHHCDLHQAGQISPCTAILLFYLGCTGPCQVTPPPLTFCVLVHPLMTHQHSERKNIIRFVPTSQPICMKHSIKWVESPPQRGLSKNSPLQTKTGPGSIPDSAKLFSSPLSFLYEGGGGGFLQEERGRGVKLATPNN